jgi:hypothetical protein
MVTCQQLIYIPEFSTLVVFVEEDVNAGVPFVGGTDDTVIEWYLVIWHCKSSIFLSWNRYVWYVK